MTSPLRVHADCDEKHSSARVGDRPESGLDPVQLEFPGFLIGEKPAAKRQIAAELLSNYLAAVCVSDPSETARRLLIEFGSLSDLLAASRWRLRPAVGERLAEVIHATRKLLQGRLLEEVWDRPIVPRSAALIDFLQGEIGFLQEERTLALYVNATGRLMHIERLSDGQPTGAAIDARKIIGRGLSIGASGLLLVHNHPSGDAKPSRADFIFTHHVRSLGAPLGLHLLDHLIIARGRVQSIEDLWREAQWNHCDEAGAPSHTRPASISARGS
jgi:DNA repair protein RadC